MKTISQKSVAAVRKANKQWKLSVCAPAMMELIRCLESNGTSVSACRGAIDAMTACVSGQKIQKVRPTSHPYADPQLLNELLKRNR